MNKERRKRLDDLATKVAELVSDLSDIQAEEQEYFDNMPESLQGGDKGTAAEDVVSNLDDAIQELESAVQTLNDVVSS